MKRGEIWSASGGAYYSGKPRPVLILQDDRFEATASITVCLLTTQAVDAPLLRPAIEPVAQTGLRETSYAMIDMISTVPRSRIGQRIGALTRAQMAPMNRAIMVFLGLAG